MLKCLSIPLAAGVQPAVASDIEAFIRCGEIASPAERLACFDTAYAEQRIEAMSKRTTSTVTETTAVASQSDETTSVEREAAAAPVQQRSATAAEADFGLPKPQDEVESEFLVSAIVRVDKDAYDRLVIHLENGQIWKQLENKRFQIPKKDPMAEIRHGSFGSFRLFIEGESRWTRVKRIQ